MGTKGGGKVIRIDKFGVFRLSRKKRFKGGFDCRDYCNRRRAFRPTRQDDQGLFNDMIYLGQDELAKIHKKATASERVPPEDMNPICASTSGSTPLVTFASRRGSINRDFLLSTHQSTYHSSPSPPSDHDSRSDPTRPMKSGCLDSNPTTKESNSSSPEIPSDFFVLNHPFRVYVLKNFIKDQIFLRDLIRIVRSFNYHRKSTDLYSYHQPDDEVQMNSKHMNRLHRSLSVLVAPFLTRLTGCKLKNDKVAISASKYQQTDYLLCHDDQTTDRLFAYILYLNDHWERSWGGLLELYATNPETVEPTHLVRSIVPSCNKLIFFPVSKYSFHAVSEILEANKDRLTINGWFHGTQDLSEVSPIFEAAISDLSQGDIDLPVDRGLKDFINAKYLKASHQASLRQIFERKGSHVLTSFLTESVYREFLSECQSIRNWERIGPPNKRNYEALTPKMLTQPLKDLCRSLVSDLMFLLISDLTGIRFHVETSYPEFAEEDENLFMVVYMPDGESNSEVEQSDEPIEEGPRRSKVFLVIRRWTHGCYTLVQDDEVEQAELGRRCLDCFITADCGRTDPDCGGQWTYVDEDKPSEPKEVKSLGDNCFHYTLMNQNTRRYIKYINCLFGTKCYYDISMIFKE